jgi:hypothetical protein
LFVLRGVPIAGVDLMLDFGGDFGTVFGVS